MIKVIKTTKSDVSKIPVCKDSLIYTIDTHETFFDLNDSERMQIRTGSQYRDEDQIFSIIVPKTNKIYISIKSNKIFRYFNNSFIEIKNRGEIVDLLIGLKELKPVVLSERGVNIAPRTLASQVFSQDGRTLDQILQDREREKQTYIYAKVVVVEAIENNQKVFDIPFPIPSYDIKKFPIEVIFGDNEYVRGNNYKINKDQIIFNDTFADRILKGNLISLIFHYSETILHGDLVEANTINGRFVVYSETEPIDSNIGDIWYNLTDRIALEKTKDGWKDILNPENIDVLTSNIYVKSGTMSIPIGIDSFDHTKDALTLYRNGLLYVEGVDYDISEDNEFIILKEPDVFEVQDLMHLYVFNIVKNGLPRTIGMDIIG